MVIHISAVIFIPLNTILAQVLPCSVLSDSYPRLVVLPTACIYVFRIILIINRDYFPK
jgi:hypothetical protein